MSESPIICAVIGRTRHRMIQAEIQEAAKRGAKLIEIRFDYLAKAPDFKRILEGKPCPIIATFRRPDDGGRWKGTEEQRQMLIRQAVVDGFDYIDLEDDIAGKIRRFGKVKRIVSYHNFKEVPADLEERYQAMCKLDPDIVKIAVTPQKVGDNLRVLRLLKDAPKPTVVLCMGDLGVCTRILNVKFGAPFTYAAFNPERTLAPGMLVYKECKSNYRIETISPKTAIFGVVGDPVGHSLSPLIHNGAYKHAGLDARYLPFRVPRGELGAFIKAYQEVPVRGYSVTIPHKEAAAKLANWRDPAVEKTGSANTLVLTSEGLKAYNTDLPAAMQSLETATTSQDTPVPLKDRTVLILGAGGVARTIAFGLLAAGTQVVIANRSLERAQKLAAEVGCRFVDWAARHGVVCDTLINCTSVGMHPNVDESPIHPGFLKPGLLVFDTIYTPETTMLLREASERSCNILTGVDMFVRQAAMQFRLFTGQEPPLDVMAQLVRRALSPVNYAKEEG